MPWKSAERRKQYKSEWYLKNRVAHIENCKRYAREHPEITAKIQRKSNYGITQDQYEQMLEDQENSCAICRRNFTEVKPQVDHDHETKLVRGILCNDCNLGLGRFKDNPELLLEAVNYLGKI